MLAESSVACFQVVYKVAELLKADVRISSNGARLSFDNCEMFLHYKEAEENSLYISYDYSIEAEFSPTYAECSEKEKHIQEKALEKLSYIRDLSNRAFYTDDCGSLLFKPNVWLRAVPDARNMEVAVNTLVNGANQFSKIWNMLLQKITVQESLQGA